MGYVALYCRISKDRAGRTEGVRAQEKWGREYAAKMWPDLPVQVFADNDISAANGDHRPQYEALREAVARGEVAQLWAVEQSRLERRPEEFFRLGREWESAGLTEFHTNREGIVQVRGLAAKLKSVVNGEEVEILYRRLMDNLKEKAERGVAPGALPFGYVHGVNERGDKTYVVVEAAAEVIRECAGRVLDGWSLTSIAADLRERKCKVCPDSEPEHKMHGPHRMKVINHQCGDGRPKKCECPVVTLDGRPVDEGGTPMTRPSTITNQTVRSWLTNLTVAGHRVHQKKDMGPGSGNWTAILDEETFVALRDRLTAPRRVLRSDGGTYPVSMATARSTARRYLLTGGIAYCGVCRAPLTASMKQFSRKPKGGPREMTKVAPYYFCTPKLGGKSCIGIMGDPFEKHVVDLLFEQLEQPAFRAALNTDAHASRRAEIEKEIVRLGGKLEVYQDQFDDDLIDRLELNRRTQKLKLRQRDLQTERASLPLPSMGDDVDWQALRDDWEELTLDVRRHYLSLTIRSVAVNRATGRGGGGNPGWFNAGRVGTPEWVPPGAQSPEGA
ncbi:recombinase family protein [Actinoplanes sp. NPDC026623]|uniref:recombinase family protein n=1 Tax=Actinoplanes sp. NPDC026623 TaxID=3155610 RepID=UPI0033EE998F